jgi:hypothetical protein
VNNSDEVGLNCSAEVGLCSAFFPDGLISHIACGLTSNINTFNTSVLALF